MSRRFLLGSIAGLFVLLLLAGTGLIWSGASHDVPKELRGASVAIGGPFTFTDTSGKAVTDATYRGKWILIYFGYTFCPDACPTALANLSLALDKLGQDADAIQPLFITIDPKRDTVSIIAEYLKSFSPRIVGLTGTQAQTDAAAKAYRVYVAPTKIDGDDYLVDHSAYFYLSDRDGRFVNVIGGEASADEIAARLRKLMAPAA